MTPEAALELLRPALDKERPLLRVEDLRLILAKNEGVLWMGERSAIFTQCTAYPLVAEFVCEAGPAAGDLKEIEAMIPGIEANARQWGCTQAMVYAGRSGWRRTMQAHGYEHFQTVWRKIL